MKNLHRIRFYSKQIDPEIFKNKGWRGWWIRVLNRVRFWIECRVIYHVMVHQAGVLGKDVVDVNAAITAFEQEEKQEAARLSFKQTRSRATSVPTGGSIEHHLKATKKVEHPSQTTERILERYAADPRTQRYAWSRNRHILMEAETNENNPENTHGQVNAESHVSRTRAGAEGNTKRVRPIHPEYAAEIFDTGDDEDDDGNSEAQRRVSYADAAVAGAANARAVSPHSGASTGDANQRPDDAGEWRPGDSAGAAEQSNGTSAGASEDD